LTGVDAKTTVFPFVPSNCALGAGYNASPGEIRFIPVNILHGRTLSKFRTFDKVIIYICGLFEIELGRYCNSST